MVRKVVYIIVVFFITLQLRAQSISDTVAEISSVESKLRYQHSLITPELDYDLEAISNGRFKLTFVNRPSEYVRIKIYDIIGNLILEEDNKYALENEIEYNFNEKNNKIYVVKVESGENNLTKKVNF